MIIYCITNKLNNKKYIGQTIQTLEQRWRRHCWKTSTKSPISLAIKKYGKENFHIEIIDAASSIEELNKKEIYWGLYFNTLSPNGYNLKLGSGSGSMHPDIRVKISASSKGRKASNETRIKLSKSHIGIKLSEEAKRKLSEHFRNKKQKAEHVCKRLDVLRKEYSIISPNGQLIFLKG